MKNKISKTILFITLMFYCFGNFNVKAENNSDIKEILKAQEWNQGTKTVAWSRVLGYFIMYVH